MRGMPENMLAGFELFVPMLRMDQNENVIRMVLTKTFIRFTNAVITQMKTPEQLLIFFDSARQRMMIQPSKKELNGIRLIKQSNTGRKTYITNTSLMAKVREISGCTDRDKHYSFSGLWIEGCANPTIIFDLSKPQVVYRQTKENIQ